MCTLLTFTMIHINAAHPLRWCVFMWVCTLALKLIACHMQYSCVHELISINNRTLPPQSVLDFQRCFNISHSTYINSAFPLFQHLQLKIMKFQNIFVKKILIFPVFFFFFKSLDKSNWGGGIWVDLFLEQSITLSIGRFRYTSLRMYTYRSCADVISRCVVFISAACYPSFLYVRYVWKPVYT